MKQFFSSKAFIWLVVAFLGASVVYGLVLSGSPSTQRALQFDQRRVSDLQQISFALDEYWVRNQNLPADLEELQDSRYYYVSSLADPETQEPYEYRVSGEKTYELCANFALSSGDNKEFARFPSPSKVWEHGAERTCFELEVQPRISPALP